MANQFMTLSLFVVLLSFFIVLNSMSSFDAVKSQAARESVARAFKNETASEIIVSRVSISPVTKTPDGDTIAKIENHFMAQIPGIDIRKNRMGDVMAIRIPVRIFERYLNMGAVYENPFVPMLVSLLQANDDAPHSIDVFLNVSTPTNEAIATVGQYAQTIEKIGLPPHLVSAGLQQGDNGTVDLIIREFIPYDMATRP